MVENTMWVRWIIQQNFWTSERAEKNYKPYKFLKINEYLWKRLDTNSCIEYFNYQ